MAPIAVDESRLEILKRQDNIDSRFGKQKEVSIRFWVVMAETWTKLQAMYGLMYDWNW